MGDIKKPTYIMSIQANELRIGNYVYNRHMELHEIGYNCFSKFMHPTMDGNPSGFSPIPLTEEWLLKFEGVNESSDDDEFHAFDFEYKGIELCKDWESGKFYHINDSALVWLDYVHTFQNLIFALTGEELKQKEG